MSLTAEIQLQYPDLKTMEDFVKEVKITFDDGKLEEMRSANPRIHLFFVVFEALQQIYGGSFKPTTPWLEHIGMSRAVKQISPYSEQFSPSEYSVPSVLGRELTNLFHNRLFICRFNPGFWEDDPSLKSVSAMSNRFL
jgi:hypothetical protein